MRDFWLCFVPLFIAVDPVGLLPMFMGLTGGMDQKQVRRVIYHSVVIATLVALAFVLVGTAVLKFLGITVADFLVAGGILLFVISLNDLVTTEKIQCRIDPDSLAAVPLAVPLISGPAVLTTSILLINEYSHPVTAAALVINIFLAGAVFRFAGVILRVFGKSGATTVSKVASLLLAAIAVMMVRKGVVSIIGHGIGG